MFALALAFSSFGVAPYVDGTTFTTDVLDLSDFTITGAISKGSGTFVIDHPLDPENKLLYHSFVESPDVKNIYDGIARLDENGEGVVRLPDYFEALNKDFRYQVKGFDVTPMPNLYVKEEIQGNTFTIAGGAPRGRVSWQVSGTRHDPYILANPIVPEVEKGPAELVQKGEYLFKARYEPGGSARPALHDLLGPFLTMFTFWE